MKILLVEDDDIDAEMARRSLTTDPETTDIHRAYEGEEALRILRGQNGQPPWYLPFLVMTDLEMPGMDGLRFIQELRNDDRLKRAPVLVLTGSEEEEDVRKAWNLNISAYVLKADIREDGNRLRALIELYNGFVQLPLQ